MSAESPSRPPSRPPSPGDQVRLVSRRRVTMIPSALGTPEPGPQQAGDEAVLFARPMESPLRRHVEVFARGTTFRGTPFTRERTLSVVARRGGDQPDPGPADDRLCDLVCCLLGEKVLGPELQRWLASRGVDLRALGRCLERHCRPAVQEGRTAKDEEAPETHRDVADLAARGELGGLLQRFLQELR